MFRLIKQVFIALLRFSGSLASIMFLNSHHVTPSIISHAWRDLLLLI